MRSIAIVLLLAGCGVKLQIAADASADASNAAVHDAAPDARACAGGDAHNSDGSGNCFVWFRGPSVWTDAQAGCSAINAHLAIITSPSQNALIDQLAKGFDSFIGATDAVTEGTFLWVDGTAVTYTNYRTGEPNNGGGSYEEDCLVIAGARTPSNQWDDRPCAPPPVGAGAYAYICEY